MRFRASGGAPFHFALAAGGVAEAGKSAYNTREFSDPGGLPERQSAALGRRSGVPELRVLVETPAPPVIGKESSAAAEPAAALAQIRSRIWVFCFRVAPQNMPLADKYGRPITEVRISVTDRCNFRCVYCRSANHDHERPHDGLLAWEELERVVRVLLGLGIRKVRITGGEPLVRPGVEEFIAQLAALGVADLSMTTNGHLLAERSDALLAAGLGRVNISLDTLLPERFEQITRTRSFDRVMDGIRRAQASRLRPVKVNAVLVRGLNDDEVESFAEFAREHDLIMRFIEFMPLDADRHWARSLVVPAAEIERRIAARWPLRAVPHARSETARKFRFADGRGEIGLIAPVTQPFCGFCSRIRVTADGRLRTCLFSKEDHDLRPLLRGGAADCEIAAFIEEKVMEKEEGHRINEPGFVPPSRTMVYIGG
jgi:cyclic pyranopterin phosphate synthase